MRGSKKSSGKRPQSPEAGGMTPAAGASGTKRESPSATLRRLRTALKKLRAGRDPAPVPEAPELESLAAAFRETAGFAAALAGGDLTTELNQRNSVAGGLKSLQSSLRHLVWQTKAVARGDLSRKIDFMGDFSTAFNTMTGKLGKAQRLLNRKNTQLQKAIDELQKEIEQRRKAEKAMRDQLAFMDSLMTSIPNPVFYKDSKGGYLGCNKAFEDYTGLRAADITGKTVLDIWPPEKAVGHHRKDILALKTGVTQIYEGSAVSGSSDERTALFSKAVFKLSDGSVGGLIGVMVDITDRKNMEGELLAAKTAAEQAAREKSDFLANMSHEIRTPINAIMGFADLLLESGVDGEKRKWLQVVKTRSADLLVIINDILDLSKVEAGMIELNPETVSIRHLLEDAATAVTPMAMKKSLAVKTEPESDIPETVFADQVRLRQILINLLGNAVKFTGKGSVTVRAAVCHDVSRLKNAKAPGPEETAIQLSVIDTGIGIPLRKQKLIFEKFTQGESSTSKKYGGAGLGLAICRTLAELMGGSIWVESEPGKGSAFHFTVKALRRAPVSGAVSPPPAESDEKTIPPRPLRILLTEDEPSNRMLMIKVLEKDGHKLTVAEDGFQALSAFSPGAFDAVLMDVQMPGMDGLETTQKIRAAEKAAGAPPVIIIALTAHAMAGFREKCLAAGMDDYLTKPLKISALRQLLAKTAR